MDSKNSYAMYVRQQRDFRFKRKKPSVEDIVEILESMKLELMGSGSSSLLNAAFMTYYSFCARKKWNVYNWMPDNFLLQEVSRQYYIGVFDAYLLIEFLSDYLVDEKIPEDLAESLNDFYQDYIPREPLTKEVYTALGVINKVIPQLRAEEQAARQAKREEETIPAADREACEAYRKRKLEEADAEKQRILDEAEQEGRRILEAAGDQGRRILESAERQANDIVEAGSNGANRRLADAAKRIQEMGAGARLQAFREEQDGVQRRFDAAREALIRANESLKRLEDSVSENMTKKVYTQFLELYDLIADTKDSAFAKGEQTGDEDLTNAAYNMDVFLDMIVEYLADYGVESILSGPGEAFDGKVHAVSKGVVQYDPREAVIRRSIRNGFRWGETVLRKELVEIE